MGARLPVGFFAYPGKPGTLLPDSAAVHVLARPDDDGVAALEALAEALGAPPAEGAPLPAPRASLPGLAVGHAVASVLPEQAIVVDESVSLGGGVFAGTAAAAPHDWLQITGGAIGCGLPLATGAAIAAPGRRVVSLQADGSAMYTVQALWTQAREELDVTTVILANRRYAILQHELAATGAQAAVPAGAGAGQVVRDMMELRRPDLDWVKLAEGQGVEAAAAADPQQMAALLAASARRRGPFLIALDLP